MEEDPKPAESTATEILPIPPSSAEVFPPQPPPSSLPPKSKKRPLENDAHFSNSSTLYKIRAVLKEVRPHFLEVLRTPDFRTCKSSEEIQEYVKLLMELCKQMTAETVSATRSKNVPGEKPQDTRAFAKPSENKFPTGVSSEKQRAEDGQTQGTYIVGGSAFGWNFITFVGEEPVYYGITKESFRANGSKETVQTME
ncbi:uncharacterized protein LOC103938663 [Pyrus x bretschneideri]|uniref:uncharacterized protein LOC103938663 n=1 Tax=Pyrus x bretschneideri TaxID=225117 RepID=UPI00202E4331|nr:uncharacterized protein LOC103938663 [Pyrus x bretschneideri]